MSIATWTVVAGDDVTSTDTDDSTEVISSTESTDTSSKPELGIIIAAAIGASVTVVLVAVAIGLCFFRSRRQKPAQGQETEASQAIEQGTAGGARPVPVPAPQILGPSVTGTRPVVRGQQSSGQLPSFDNVEDRGESFEGYWSAEANYNIQTNLLVESKSFQCVHGEIRSTIYRSLAGNQDWKHAICHYIGSRTLCVSRTCFSSFIAINF